jgi:predicted esterase YcpF (UPF0227 family)
MPTSHLLYLHGFRSSPQSTKAQLVRQHVERLDPRLTFWCPQLPPSPKLAMEEVMAGIAAWPREHMAVIGSSLGGFYATWVAEQTGCRAAVLNPAVHPERDLARYIGELTSWHDPADRFYFRPDYVDELRALQCGPITRPERYYALIAKGDEVLDWREMVVHYPGAQIRLLEGSDHAISGFADYLDEVLAFVGLPWPAA